MATALQPTLNTTAHAGTALTAPNPRRLVIAMAVIATLAALAVAVLPRSGDSAISLEAASAAGAVQTVAGPNADLAAAWVGVAATAAGPNAGLAVVWAANASPAPVAGPNADLAPTAATS